MDIKVVVGVQMPLGVRMQRILLAVTHHALRSFGCLSLRRMQSLRVVVVLVQATFAEVSISLGVCGL